MALVLGAALMFLWANGALNAAGDAVLAAVVVVALGLILAPLVVAARSQPRRRTGGADPLPAPPSWGAHLHD